jgi:hypothetical protein
MTRSMAAASPAQYRLPQFFSNSIGQFDQIWNILPLPAHNDFA